MRKFLTPALLALSLAACKDAGCVRNSDCDPGYECRVTQPEAGRGAGGNGWPRAGAGGVGDEVAATPPGDGSLSAPKCIPIPAGSGAAGQGSGGSAGSGTAVGAGRGGASGAGGGSGASGSGNRGGSGGMSGSAAPAAGNGARAGMTGSFAGMSSSAAGASGAAGDDGDPFF